MFAPVITLGDLALAVWLILLLVLQTATHLRDMHADEEFQNILRLSRARRS